MNLKSKIAEEDRYQNRYQNQPWYVKLWRRRHMLPVPFYTLRTWLHANKRFYEHHLATAVRPTFSSWIRSRGNVDLRWDNHWRKLGTAWSVEMGEATLRMEWWFTLDEVKEDLAKAKEKKAQSAKGRPKGENSA